MPWPKRLDITGGLNDTVYLTRWTLVRLFGRSLYLHLFHRPDVDECLHDHPWSFWTLVLWGGYWEETPEGHRRLLPLSLHYRPASYRHRITDLPQNRAWTLVLTGSRQREWGFWTRRGWVHWVDFIRKDRLSRILWCRDE